MKSPFEGWKSSLVKVIEVLYLLWIKKVPWININNLKLVPQSYFDFLYPFILIFPFHPQIPKPLHLGAGVCLVSLQLAWSHLKTLSGNNKTIVQWKYVELWGIPDLQFPCGRSEQLLLSTRCPCHQVSTLSCSQGPSSLRCASLAFDDRWLHSYSLLLGSSSISWGDS